MRTLTQCPECFEGKRWQGCPSCDGQGATLDVELCPECDGAGEVEVKGPCPVCSGDGQVRWGTMRIHEADLYCKPYGGDRWATVDTSPGALPGSIAVEVGDRVVLEDVHHGATIWSLAAWGDLRHVLLAEGVTCVRGTVGWMVPEAPGRRTIPASAVAIETPKTVLYLSGLSWGYGGEGPNGTAAIMDDLGMFPCYDDALTWIAAQPMDRPWRREL